MAVLLLVVVIVALISVVNLKVLIVFALDVHWFVPGVDGPAAIPSRTAWVRPLLLSEYLPPRTVLWDVD